MTFRDNSNNEIGFSLEMALSKSGPFLTVKILSENETAYSHTGLSPDTLYYYRISAFNSAGSSEYSAIASAKTDTAPTETPQAPSNLTAEASGSSSVQLYWHDNSQNETGFIIERSYAVGGPYGQIMEVNANITEALDTGLSPITTYCYRVWAHNSQGLSPLPTNEACATTQQEPISPPQAPENLLASAVSQHSIRLTWTDNSDNEQGFKIERSNASGGPFSVIVNVPANSTSFLNTGLSQGTNYCYRIFAFNAAGESSYSNTDCATTHEENDPSDWESTLYTSSWIPPHERDDAPRFDVSGENGKMIQDFSYAGYRRGEVPIPDVSGPVFDVTAYGADSTGVNNSTTPIQNAINAAQNAGGGVVYLPPGTYRVAPSSQNNKGVLRITKSNIVLRGAGTDQTYLYNDSPEMREVQNIILLSYSPTASNLWWDKTGSETPITSDLLSPTRFLPVQSTAGYASGDWVAVATNLTAEFCAEHQMTNYWPAYSSLIKGVLFYRKIVDINHTTKTITIDTPTRYYLKTRDGARIFKTIPMIEEVGIENFSIGNRPSPKPSPHDTINDPATAAYDTHLTSAIYIHRVRNGWVRNVKSYGVSGSSHILSKGITLSNSIYVTIDGCNMQRAQNRGDGGNGYAFHVNGAQEILLRDSVSLNAIRHPFVIAKMKSSGIVIKGCSGIAASDTHMWLSQSCLIDNYFGIGSLWSARNRGTTSLNAGWTSTQSVFWNTYGASYYGSLDYIVNSQQWRQGYIIGTSGPANNVRGNDHTEGVGLGDALWPPSLYDDQLARRLNR